MYHNKRHISLNFRHFPVLIFSAFKLCDSNLLSPLRQVNFSQNHNVKRKKCKIDVVKRCK